VAAISKSKSGMRFPWRLSRARVWAKISMAGSVRRMGEVIGTLENLAEGNNADRKSVGAKALGGFECGGNAGERINDPVAVNRVAHGRSLGRLPPSRAR
jgi:hypothetical protein